MRRLTPALLLAALLAGGYFLLWSQLADEAEGAARAWIDTEKAKGRVIEAGEIATGGFPFRIELTFAKTTAGEEGSDVSWLWQSDSVVAYARPWRPHHLIVEPGTRHTVYLRRGPFETQAEVQTRNAVIRFAPTPGGEGFDFALAAEEIALGGRRLAKDVLLEVRREATSTERLGIVVELTDFALAQDPPPALPSRIEHLRLIATARGPWADAPAGVALAHWRDAGGVLDVGDFGLRWGPLQIEAEGSLSLDREMRAIGAMTAKIRAWPELLKTLEAYGRIKPEDARLIEAALDVMAQEEEGKRFVEVPLSAQAGRLYLGPFAILRFEPLWPVADYPPDRRQ
jgi:hypothetical protein